MSGIYGISRLKYVYTLEIGAAVTGYDGFYIAPMPISEQIFLVGKFAGPILVGKFKLDQRRLRV